MPTSAPARPSRSSARPILWAAVAVAAAVAGVIAFWNSLHYFFAQDAFTLLARARDLAPRPGGVWRLLSYDLYFRAMDAGFGLDPRPYRVVALLLHAVNGALVCLLARRLGLSAGAGLLAGVFFAVHNVHFEALFAVATIAEPMAATLTMVALLVALPPGERPSGGGRVWTVTAVYLAALLTKESVVLFPALLWVAARGRPNACRGAILPCAIVALLYAALFWMSDPFGGLQGDPARPNPYRPAWGGELLATWTTYASWATRLVNLYTADISDGIAPHPEGWVVTALFGVALLGLAIRARRQGPGAAPALRAALVGAAFYLCFVAPVLPLANHAYRFYLYLPVVGLGWLLAAVWDAWAPKRLRPAVWGLALLIAAYGTLVVRNMEVVPLGDTGLRFLGSVRRAETARRVLETLPAGSGALPEDLAMLGPDALSPPSRPDTTQLGAFLFNDVAGALDEGNGIRLRFPGVRRVRFFGDLGPWLEQPDVVVFDYLGGVKRGPAAWLYLRRAEVEWESHRAPDALDALRRAEEMTLRWAREVPAGPWRRHGLEGIRMQAESMLRAEGSGRESAGDPRTAARREYELLLTGVALAAR